MRFFPRLKELDGMAVTEAVRQQIKEGQEARRGIMVFFYKIDRGLVRLS
jgi:hypothetical protein